MGMYWTGCQTKVVTKWAKVVRKTEDCDHGRFRTFLTFSDIFSTFGHGSLFWAVQ